jgi:large subunit ribosomal protein L10
MNKDQKAAVVEEVAAQIEAAEALFALDYRGISVPQAAELRQRLNDAGARFRVVKNTLTIRAAEQAGAEDLKGLLEGPTAFTFVASDGDVALAAKALSQFRREHQLLEFKGGRMNGEPLTIEQIQSIAQLPARDVLDGQLVGMLASPITGLVRGLNQLIAGLAQQLQQVVEQGLIGGEAEAAEPEAQGAEPEAEAAADGEAAEPEAQAAEPEAEAAADAEAAEPEAAAVPSEEEGGGDAPAQEAEQDAQEDAAESEAVESAGEESGDEQTSSEESSPADESTAEEKTDEQQEG